MFESSGDIGAELDSLGGGVNDLRRRSRWFEIVSGANPYTADEVYVKESDGSRNTLSGGYSVTAAQKLLWEANGSTTVPAGTVVEAVPNDRGSGFVFTFSAGGGLPTENLDATEGGTTTTLWLDQDTGIRKVKDSPVAGEDTFELNAVPLSSLATMANDRVLGNVSGAAAVPAALTGAQVTPLLSVFAASGAGHAKGLVPTPGAVAGTTKFLREDATWQVPAGGGAAIAVTQITFPIAGTHAITSAKGVYAAVPDGSLALAAGTYVIHYSLRGAINCTQAAWIAGRLKVGGVVIGGSELLVVQCPANERTADHSHQTVGPVIVTAGQTVDVEVKKDDAGGGLYITADLFNTADGSCTLVAWKFA